MSTLGDRLRQLRGTTSQSAFAAPLDMKYQQYARYETGDTIPSAELLAKICRIHACSADWLLGLDNAKGNNAITYGSHSVAVAGSNSSVVIGNDPPRCESCPYKKRIKALQRLLKVD